MTYHDEMRYQNNLQACLHLCALNSRLKRVEMSLSKLIKVVECQMIQPSRNSAKPSHAWWIYHSNYSFVGRDSGHVLHWRSVIGWLLRECQYQQTYERHDWMRDARLISVAIFGQNYFHLWLISRCIDLGSMAVPGISWHRAINIAIALSGRGLYSLHVDD